MTTGHMGMRRSSRWMNFSTSSRKGYSLNSKISLVLDGKHNSQPPTVKAGWRSSLCSCTCLGSKRLPRIHSSPTASWKRCSHQPEHFKRRSRPLPWPPAMSDSYEDRSTDRCASSPSVPPPTTVKVDDVEVRSCRSVSSAALTDNLPVRAFPPDSRNIFSTMPISIMTNSASSSSYSSWLPPSSCCVRRSERSAHSCWGSS
jgi:hypothetical protein